MDDGIRGHLSFDKEERLSVEVRSDILASGFALNDEKSNWASSQVVTFLGVISNFESRMISIPERRISKLKVCLEECQSKTFIQARKLASVTGQIISMFCAVGNITRLLTQNCYHAIEQRRSWEDRLPLSAGVAEELSFWLRNINSFNGKVMVSKSSVVGVVYSDASDTGFGGYSIQCGRDLVSGQWSPNEKQTSSTLREILAVKYVLLSLIDKLSGCSIKWFTDNQNVPRIISNGSSKEHLQKEALDISNLCCFHNISVEMEWIPRSQNDQADFLSRICDSDDWGLSEQTFSKIDQIWGPHSIDRFANHLNLKLPRFNSRFWNLDSEDIDAFVLDWSGENNYVCPPICLIPRVLLHMRNCKATGTLIVPHWPLCQRLGKPSFPVLVPVFSDQRISHSGCSH